MSKTPIHDAFLEFAVRAIPADVPAPLYEQCRDSFMAGARAVLVLMADQNLRRTSTFEKVALVRAMRSELDSWLRS